MKGSQIQSIQSWCSTPGSAEPQEQRPSVCTQVASGAEGSQTDRMTIEQCDRRDEIDPRDVPLPEAPILRKPCLKPQGPGARALHDCARSACKEQRDRTVFEADAHGVSAWRTAKAEMNLMTGSAVDADERLLAKRKVRDKHYPPGTKLRPLRRGRARAGRRQEARRARQNEIGPRRDVQKHRGTTSTRREETTDERQ